MSTQIQQDVDRKKEQYATPFASRHLALSPAKKYLVCTQGPGRLSWSNTPEWHADFLNDDGIAARRGNGGKVKDDFDFQLFTDPQDALKQDVEFLKGHEGLAKDVPVSGWIFDVATGRVTSIV